MYKSKYVLIDNLYPEEVVVYGPFDEEDNALTFSVLIDQTYNDNSPDFGRGWIVKELVEPDWEQFGK